MKALRKWYLSKIEEWEKASVITPRTKEKVSEFYDMELDKNFPILKPNSKVELKVYEYGSVYDFGGFLPTIVVAYPYYALVYDYNLKRVEVFRGKKGINQAFGLVRAWANRFKV